MRKPPKVQDQTEPRDQPLDRAFAFLAALASAARPTSVTELATLCAIPVPTAHRLAGQLEQRGLVKRALASKKLLVGPALVQLGMAAAEAAVRSDRVHSILVALAAKLGEPCQIGVRAGNEVVYVDTVRAARSSGLHFEQGRHAPIHSSSIGKIFLAEMPDEQLDLWLQNTELTRLTPATIVSTRKMKATLKDVRRNGWSASNEEFAPGVVGCAVPIRLPNGSLIAGLGISVPSARASFSEVKAHVPALQRAAREIAAAALE
jgi:DNA-binding IclR family transcriptional regulator